MFVVNVASCYFASSLEASVTIHCYDFAFTTAVGSGLSLYCWFAGGLRIIDINDPANPKERGYFIPKPGDGVAAPLTNDVFKDHRVCCG
jgi:hypothetical protein